ncbi:MAG: hypothetical protein ABII82_05950, partial [Verrucomicrobiota bacterium]
MPISFNELLTAAKIDPSRVKLVRHQDGRFEGSPYQLWRAGDGSFECYQRIQSKPRFLRADYVASFVATPLNETLFVGLYCVAAVGTAPAGTIDPLSGGDEAGRYLYDLQLAPEMDEYRARLIIEWGAGKRSWVQRAHKQPKPIIELRRSAGDPPFPGFLDFCDRLSALATLPQLWRQMLSSVRGVYLLVCPTTGKQYVGSAGGDAGFWSRWEDYAASG